MTQISRRAYAKRRNVTEAAIRKRIADGTLSSAMTADGKINPDLADKLLAENTTGGNQTTAGLSEARRRKAAASIALLRDEVEAFERGFAPAQVIDALRKRVSLVIAAHFLKIVPDTSAHLAGKPPAIAAKIIDDAVFAALIAISETKRKVDTEGASKPQKGKALAKMTAVELATLRADLLARRMEVERQVKRQELVSVKKFEAEFMNRIVVIKTNAQAMHAKLATRFQKASAEKARKILLTEIHWVIEPLISSSISKAVLHAAKIQPGEVIRVGY